MDNGAIIGFDRLRRPRGLWYGSSIENERNIAAMRNVSAHEYAERLDRSQLSHADKALVDDAFSRMRTIDRKLFALKAERRALADLFLLFISAQAERGGETEGAENDNNPDNAPGINGERKTLYGVHMIVQNTQDLGEQ